MIAERRRAPYADAQYWGRYGRYGRCIVKGYPLDLALWPHCAVVCFIWIRLFTYPPNDISEMTYTVSSGTLNSTIIVLYHAIPPNDCKTL